jgi:transcriptional regulator NrdR family protein
METALIDIIKHEGRRPSEQFQRQKLHASLYAACLSVRAHEGEARRVADTICDIVVSWCNTKPEVTSNDIRRIAAGHLEAYHPEAAYVYKHHKLVL